jgi:CRP/FNR family cyclic AMP-dependent transcriptional regulator
MTSPGVVHLLDVDPDLGQLLAPERAAAAHADLVAKAYVVPRGAWQIQRLVAADREHLGLLLFAGLVVREVAVADSVSAELLGPGDVLRPWQPEPARLLRGEGRLIVLDTASVAALDHRVLDTLGLYPEVTMMLIDRLAQRAHRIAAEKAIAQLNGIHRRLLAMFWLLAERWGRVAGEGIVVPLALPHRVIAQLIGARRPSVSTALGQLASTGHLQRRADGTWLLTGEPVGAPAGDATRAVTPRKRRFAPRRDSGQLHTDDPVKRAGPG